LIRFHSARFAGLLIHCCSGLAGVAGDDRFDVRRLCGERRAFFRFLAKDHRRTALWERGQSQSRQRFPAGPARATL
jgi:hypothetical protein